VINHPSISLAEAGAAREQGGDVPVVAHAEQYQIELWRLARTRSKEAAEHRLALRGRGSWVVGLASRAVDISRRDRHPREHQIGGHREMAVGPLERDAALVAPEHVHIAPRDVAVEPGAEA